MLTNGKSFSFTWKLLTLFLVFAALCFAKEFLIPLAAGGILATLFLPVCKWFEEKKIPKVLACLLCVLIVLLFIAGIAMLVGWQVSRLASEAGQIKQKLVEMISNIQQYIYDRLGLSKEEQIRILKEQQSSVSAMISGVAGSTFSVFTSGVLILVYLCLLLYYRKHLKDFILRVVPADQKTEMQQSVYIAAQVSQQYLTGLGKMIFCLWIMYSIGFSIVGVKNAIFFAILCGLLEIIPFIGNLTGTAITLFASSVQGADSGMLIGIIITYGIVQFIQGWVLETVIVGPQVKLNPLFTILALVAGEIVWGIPGIILAIPLLAMFKIFCDHIDSLKPYGFLFGETADAKKQMGIDVKISNWIKQKMGRR